jgi:hypothetical protein
MWKQIFGEILQQGGRAAIKNADDFANKVLYPALQNAYTSGKKELYERLTREAQNLGLYVPSPKGPGLIGQDPSTVNRAIQQVRSQQAPVPQFGTGVQARERGGALVPLGGRGAAPTNRNIPSAEFMPELPAPAPRPGNLVGPEGTQLSIGTTRFRPGAKAPTEMVSKSGRITPEGANVGGRVMPRGGVPVANTAADTQVAEALANLKGASEFPIPGTRFSPRPADPFLDDQLSLFGRANPESEFSKAIQRFEAARSGLVPSASDLVPRRGVNLDPAASDLVPRGGVNLDPLDVDFEVVGRVGYPGATRRALNFDPAAPDLLARKAAGEGTDFSRENLLKALIGGGGLTAAGIAGLSRRQAPSQTPYTGMADASGDPLAPSRIVEDTATNAATGTQGAQATDALTTTNPPVPPVTRGPASTIGESSTSAQRSLVREAVATDPAAAAALRMTEPMSPEKYGSLAEYRKAVSDYAGQADTTRELVEFMRARGSSPVMSENLATWAQANPALAYALQQREYARQNNQQSPEVAASSTVGTSNDANAVGNAMFAGDAAVEGDQGSFDLKSATDMVLLPKAMRTPAPALLETYLQSVGAVG